jgi:multicomponent Na+:H+ antiporter subunit C
MSGLPGLYNYWVVVFLMMAGFYVVIAQGNLVKKLVGLGLFQASVFIFYITIGKVADGRAPIFEAGTVLYSNPLPHVLILTAIVVGVATTAVGLALVVRIHEAYGSVEEDEIHARDLADEQAPDGGDRPADDPPGEPPP